MGVLFANTTFAAMWSYIFTILVFYILFRFVVRVVIPIGSTYLKMRRKMREMQDIHQQQHRRSDQQQYGPSNTSSTTSAKGDYIDFEEVK